jgi:hypothetical protein
MPHVATPNQNELARVTLSLLYTQISRELLGEQQLKDAQCSAQILSNIKYKENNKDGVVTETMDAKIEYKAAVVPVPQKDLINKRYRVGQYLPALPRTSNLNFLVLNEIKVTAMRKIFRVTIGYGVGYSTESSREIITVGDSHSAINYQQATLLLLPNQQEDFLVCMIEWCQQLLESLQVSTNCSA